MGRNPKRKHVRTRQLPTMLPQSGQEAVEIPPSPNGELAFPDLSAHIAEADRLDERPEGAVTEFTEIVDEIPPEAEPIRKKPSQAEYQRAYRQRLKDKKAGIQAPQPPEPPLVDTVLGLPPEELHAFFKEVLEVVIDEAHTQLQWSRPSEMWKLRMTEIHAKLALKYLGDTVQRLPDEIKLVIFTAIWVGPQIAAHWEAPGMRAIRERVLRVVQFFVRKTKRASRDSRTKANGQNNLDVGGSADTAASSPN